MEKELLYFENFRDNFEKYQKEEKDRDIIKKLSFYGVNIVKGFFRKQNQSLEENIDRFHFISLIKNIMGELTPNEFMNVFPISKDYKGHKWGMKDYFYTKKYIDSLEVDKPIGSEDEILKFLWEYHNWDITEFVVESMSCISDFNTLQGEQTLIEGFAQTIGIDLYEVHEDGKGNKFLIDKKGNATKISKPRPRYLKVVK